MSTALAMAGAPRMKSPEAFRTISEVSLELDVPQHVLRFWETRFSQMRPIKRAGGRRFYRPEDVDLLRGIRTLLYFEGYTIKGVQKVMRDRGLRYVAETGRGDAAFESPAERAADAAFAADRPVAAFAALARVHADAVAAAGLDEAGRVRLELLLGELQQLKARLRAARPAGI